MGLKILVNDEEVWESSGEAVDVSAVSVNVGSGEAAKVLINNSVDAVNIIVEERSTTHSTYLDIEDVNRRQELGEKREEADKDMVAEGRAKMAEEDFTESSPMADQTQRLEPSETGDENEIDDQIVDEYEKAPADTEEKVSG